MSTKTTYIEGIKKLILSNKDFKVAEVRNLEFLKGLNFIKDEYPKILELIKKKRMNEVKRLPDVRPKSFEDLTILKFFNEDNKAYIILVYETDEMWQDPVILDIVPQ